MDIFFNGGNIKDSWLINLAESRLVELACQCVEYNKYFGDISTTCVCIEVCALEDFIADRPWLLRDEELKKCGFKEVLRRGVTINPETHQTEWVEFWTYEKELT